MTGMTPLDSNADPEAPRAGRGSGLRLLRLLVAADLAPGRSQGPLPVAGGPDGVDAALAELSPALAFAVPSHLWGVGAGARELEVACRFRSLADFAPGALARAVPELAPLLAARAALAAGAEGKAPAGPPAAPVAGPADDPLAALLSQVELPADPAALQALPLPELLGGGAGGGSAPAAARLAEIDRRLSRQVAEISAAPPLRALEAAWRGVAFLAARAGGSSGVSLEILATDRDSLLDTFYDRVFGIEHEGTSAVPLSAVVLGWELDRGPADLEDLRHLAKMGESLAVPFLGAVGPGFWGVRQAGLLANLPDLVRKVEGSEYAKWNALRREEAALWLCLAANRLLLRSAWAEEGEAARAGFSWRDPGAADRPLWGSGAWGLGAVLAQAFAAGGLRFPMTGAAPAAELAFASPTPLEVPLSDQKALELARVGLVPLIAKRGETTARFLSVPAVHLPKRYDREEATRAAAAQATLPYQAFAGAAAHAIAALGRELPAGLAADELERRFTCGLRAFLGEEPEAAPAAPETPETPADPETPPPPPPPPPIVAVEVQSDPESPDVWTVLARLRPRFPISGNEVDLVLGSAVPR